MRGRKGGREREQTLLFLNVGEVKINKDVVLGRGPLKVGFAEPAKYTDTQKHTHCVCVCVCSMDLEQHNFNQGAAQREITTAISASI